MVFRRGDNGNNVLNGTTIDDILYGEGGNDTLNGLGGNDLLWGGGGSDILEGGDGDDQLVGDRTDTTTTIPGGADTLRGGDGNDFLDGQVGTDSLVGEDGNDELYGGSGFDYLNGGADNDLLVGEGDDDWIIGGTGNDTIIGGFGSEAIGGGAGSDQFQYYESFRFSSFHYIDRINDFTSGSDKLVFSRNAFDESIIFTINAGSTLVASEFAVVGSNAAAATSNAQFVYNSANGAVFYNPDKSDPGFGASGGQFITLTNRPALTRTDLLIV